MAIEHPQLTYRDTVANWRAAGRAVVELDAGGRVAVAPAGGRIIAFAPELDDTNLLWSGDAQSGLGGDRLWFAPEAAYFWHGSPDREGFTNYRVPRQMDPGNYAVTRDGDTIRLCASMRLTATDGGPTIAFALERSVRAVEAPVPCHGLSYVGVETTHRVIVPSVPTGRLGMWHVAQVPAGSWLIVPIRSPTSEGPLPYGHRGMWNRSDERVDWHFTGTENAKFGLSAQETTGRTAVLARAGSEFSLLVRDFPVHHAGRYVDCPPESPRQDQVVQAWDGGGFGEMEFHGPEITRDHRETDRLWGFRGQAPQIADVARELLAVSIDDLIEQLADVSLDPRRP